MIQPICPGFAPSDCANKGSTGDLDKVELKIAKAPHSASRKKKDSALRMRYRDRPS